MSRILLLFVITVTYGSDRIPLRETNITRP